MARESVCTCGRIGGLFKTNSKAGIEFFHTTTLLWDEVEYDNSWAAFELISKFPIPILEA